MTRLTASEVLFSLAAIAITGCGAQPYPSTLTYPLRADGLVAQLPDRAPDGPPPAGKLDEFINQINERGGKVYNPADLLPEQREKLRQALGEIFGSPAAPLIQCDDDESRTLADHFQFRPEKLAKGSILYKRLCLQCHGLTGDGRGPTGMWVYPTPRDFRQGIFKFVSSAGSAARKPTQADLHRLLKVGVERTSMPPFAMLSDDDRELIVNYSIHLSLRGEVEYRAMGAILSASDEMEDDIAADVRSHLKTALRQWVEADREAIVPQSMPTPESPGARMSAEHLDSVRRGFHLFTSPAIGCIGCHVDYGRQARYLYDAWGGTSRPTDLTEGAFRGGKTPLDLFHRIRGGIDPSGMPAATSLTEAQVWDLVHFVQALPYSRMLPDDVRGQVYR